MLPEIEFSGASRSSFVVIVVADRSLLVRRRRHHRHRVLLSPRHDVAGRAGCDGVVDPFVPAAFAVREDGQVQSLSFLLFRFV